MIKYLIPILTLLILGCQQQINKRTYRAELIIDSNLSIPFMLVKERSAYFIENGEERIELLTSFKGDSIVLEHPVFNAFLVFADSNHELSGFWYNREKADYRMSFRAEPAKVSFDPGKSNAHLKDRYSVLFGEQDPTPAVGIFHELNGRVNGTFLTETGDYRYLNGVLRADTLWLSTFDMSHAYLFYAVLRDQTLEGMFYSGHHWHEVWKGNYNPNAELTDAMDLVHVKDTVNVNFRVTGLSGEMITLDHPLFRDKAVIVQLFGSWCPNCYDESRYLNSIYSKYTDDLEILGVAFERSADESSAKLKIEKFRKGLDIQYPLSYGGLSNKDSASQVFPFLDRVYAFPSLLFFDRSHSLKGVHSGFNGPGTGENYLQTKKNIEQIISELISE